MQSDLTQLESARTSIRSQFAERAADFPGFLPVHPWTQISPVLSYVFDLPVEQLQRIRLHVDPIMGVHSSHHFLVLPPVDGDIYSKQTGYEWLGLNVPENLWADEPAVPGLPQIQYGTKFRGRVINDFAVTNQQNVCNLSRLGIGRIPGRTIFVEIGAGYGGFALNALRLLPDCTYVVVDMPETLIFSAAFLMTHRPDLRTYVYRPGDDLEAVMEATVEYDLIFIPNYRADALRQLPYISVGYNSLSFPEMENDAMRLYLGIIAPKLTHFFMSVNYRGVRTPGGPGVDDILAQYFTLAPTPAEYRAGLRLTTQQMDSLHCRPVLIGTTCAARRLELAGSALREISPLIVKVTTGIGERTSKVSKPPLLERAIGRLKRM